MHLFVGNDLIFLSLCLVTGVGIAPFWCLASGAADSACLHLYGSCGGSSADHCCLLHRATGETVSVNVLN